MPGTCPAFRSLAAEREPLPGRGVTLRETILADMLFSWGRLPSRRRAPLLSAAPAKTKAARSGRLGDAEPDYGNWAIDGQGCQLLHLGTWRPCWSETGHEGRQGRQLLWGWDWRPWCRNLVSKVAKKEVTRVPQKP